MSATPLNHPFSTLNGYPCVPYNDVCSRVLISTLSLSDVPGSASGAKRKTRCAE